MPEVTLVKWLQLGLKPKLLGSGVTELTIWLTPGTATTAMLPLHCFADALSLFLKELSHVFPCEFLSQHSHPLGKV